MSSSVVCTDRSTALSRLRDFGGLVAERDQRAARLAPRRADAVRRTGAPRSRRELTEAFDPIAHFDQQALGGLAAHAGNAHQRIRVLRFDAHQEVVDAHAGQQSPARASGRRWTP